MIASELDPSRLWTDHSIKLAGFAEAGAPFGATHYLTERMHVLLRSIVQQRTAYVNTAHCLMCIHSKPS